MKFRLTDTNVNEMGLVLGDVVQNGEVKLIVRLAVGLYRYTNLNLNSLVILNNYFLVWTDDQVDMLTELKQRNC